MRVGSSIPNWSQLRSAEMQSPSSIPSIGDDQVGDDLISPNQREMDFCKE
jgi:hypothetical protein